MARPYPQGHPACGYQPVATCADRAEALQLGQQLARALRCQVRVRRDGNGWQLWVPPAAAATLWAALAQADPSRAETEDAGIAAAHAAPSTEPGLLSDLMEEGMHYLLEQAMSSDRHDPAPLAAQMPEDQTAWHAALAAQPPLPAAPSEADLADAADMADAGDAGADLLDWFFS